MKTIIKVWLFMLAVGLLSQCKKEPLAKVTIPDDNFLNALIEQGVDSNGDGIITTLEAYKSTSLTVDGKSISDLTGIEAFVNIDRLNCSNNLLTSLDVSNNTYLAWLNCSNNLLTSLDVSNNTFVDWLNCSNNLLTRLDVSNNTRLYWLYCSNNQLTTLDVSNFTYFEQLDCSNNQLTSLDVSPGLGQLDCSNNQLTTLDVSNITYLEQLDCSNNQLTSLDVSNNTYLKQLDCSNNQLTSLDVSNNTRLSELYLMYMPSLYEVCVWEMPFPPAGVEVDTSGSPNVYFTTDCSK